MQLDKELGVTTSDLMTTSGREKGVNQGFP